MTKKPMFINGWYSARINQQSMPLEIKDMKTYHYLILAMLFLAHGWLFYQKNHSGPDIYDWFRAINHENSVLSKLETEPSAVLGQEVTLYASWQTSHISRFIDDYHDEVKIYYSQSQGPAPFNCPAEYIKLTGVIEQNGNQFFLSSINSVHSYINDRSSTNHGMLTDCLYVSTD